MKIPSKGSIGGLQQKYGIRLHDKSLNRT